MGCCDADFCDHGWRYAQRQQVRTKSATEAVIAFPCNGRIFQGRPDHSIGQVVEIEWRAPADACKHIVIRAGFYALPAALQQIFH